MTRPARPVKRALLVEPDPWRAASLRAFLAEEGFEVVEAGRVEGEPDLGLVNLCDRKTEIRARVEKVRAEFPDVRLIAFVYEVDASTVFPCLLLGFKGVLPFDAKPEEIRAAVQCVLDGSIWTPRPVLSQWIDRVLSLGIGEANDRAFTASERKVLAGIRDDLSNKEIARRVGISEATVKFHIGKLLKKTGTKDRRELARFVAETVLGPAEGAEDSTEV